MEEQGNNQQPTPAGVQYQQPQQANPYQQPQANPYQQQAYQQPYQQAPPSQSNSYQQQPNPYQQAQQGQLNPYPQQPSNPYQSGYYAHPPVPRQNSGYAIAGLILGIISIGFFWSWYVGFPVGAAGLVLSIFGKKHGPKRMAIAGLICSIVGLAALIGIFGYEAWCSYW